MYIFTEYILAPITSLILLMQNKSRS
uniref:Uncharacterized protein n=1 Tax=Anguilla anguilla TaxID=7936 RepID=A0A0E9WLF3_ANGAN